MKLTLENKIVRTSCILIILIISVLVGGLIGLWITGGEPRRYKVFNPSDKIANYTALELARKYKPYIYQEASIKPQPTKIFYEVVNASNSIIIAYRVFWSDEYHPNGIIDALYRVFRSAYYGDPADIETIEIKLNPVTLNLEEIAFEILKPGSSEKLPGHQPVILRIEKDSIYLTYDSHNESLNFKPFNKTHLILQVNTWNHLFSLEQKPRGTLYDLPLIFLTNEDYRHYKMVRRSAIFLKQKESLAITGTIVFGLVVTIFLILYILIFARDKLITLMKKKS